MGYTFCSDNFDIRQIADSGQCFRMIPVTTGNKHGYRTIYKGHYVEVYQESGSNKVEVSCDEDTFNNVWREYFDLDTDYSSYADRLIMLNDNYITKAYQYGKGIRILKQDPFEMLISYIISQQKRIPNIMATVEKLCKVYGTKVMDEFTKKEYYTFPNSDEILSDVSKLDDLKLGYRDKYIIAACEDVRSVGIEWFTKGNVYERAMTVKGVGPKVANCYALFGCHQLNRFPIDTWINKILSREYPGGINLTGCEDFAGLIQQYMFYYERSIS